MRSTPGGGIYFSGSDASASELRGCVLEQAQDVHLSYYWHGVFYLSRSSPTISKTGARGRAGARIGVELFSGGLGHKSAQDREPCLVMGLKEVGRTLRFSYPWKWKLTEG
jgi:hypothetical protein